MKNEYNEQLHNALFLDTSEEIIESVKDLVNKGADINFINSNGTAILHDAIVDGDLELVRSIIDLGADVNLKSNSGDTPLEWAENSANNEIVYLLFEKGAKISEIKKPSFGLQVVANLFYGISI